MKYAIDNSSAVIENGNADHTNENRTVFLICNASENSAIYSEFHEYNWDISIPASTRLRILLTQKNSTSRFVSTWRTNIRGFWRLSPSPAASRGSHSATAMRQNSEAFRTSTLTIPSTFALTSGKSFGPRRLPTFMCATTRFAGQNG